MPDFFVRVKSGDIYLCELKGREDNLVPLKAKAAVEWCKSASKGKVKWHYLYIPYLLFQQNPTNSLEKLARACAPSLQNLIKEGVSEQIYIDFDAVDNADISDPLFERIMKIASIDTVPEDIHENVRQALLILDHAERADMKAILMHFSCCFNLDEYATKLLVNGLQDKIPTDIKWRDAYFIPDTSKVLIKKEVVRVREIPKR